MCVLIDQEEAFELRPPRRKRRRCVRRRKRCSRRRSKRETKADVIKPLDMNDAWKILVGVQFISSKTFSKSHYMDFHNNRQKTYRNQQTRRSLVGRISELFFSISFIHVDNCSLSFATCSRCIDEGIYSMFSGNASVQLMSVKIFSKGLNGHRISNSTAFHW